jgi:hypothetical protein
LPWLLQVLVDRDHVSRLGGVDQGTDGGVDQLVFVAVEVAVGEQVAHAVPGAVVQQQPPSTLDSASIECGGHAQLRDLAVGRKVVFNRG